MLKRLLFTFIVVAVCAITTTNAVSLRQVEAGDTNTAAVSAAAPDAPIVS